MKGFCNLSSCSLGGFAGKFEGILEGMDEGSRGKDGLAGG